MWEIEAEPGCSGWCAAACGLSCIGFCMEVTGGLYMLGGIDMDSAGDYLRNGGPIMT